MNTNTTRSLIATIAAFTRADSCTPTISSIEIANTTTTAGKFAHPRTIVPSGSADNSNGLAIQRSGSVMPKLCSSETRYADQLMDTVAAPTAYSITKSHPMIHAIHSPSVA